MPSFVFDASAVLAMIHGEPGEEFARRNSSGSLVSAVNVAEVGARLADRGVSEAQVRLSMRASGLEVTPFDAEMAYASASLRNETRSSGLSLGDRACLRNRPGDRRRVHFHVRAGFGHELDVYPPSRAPSSL